MHALSTLANQMYKVAWRVQISARNYGIHRLLTGVLTSESELISPMDYLAVYYKLSHRFLGQK